jgi:hypothetical protein
LDWKIIQEAWINLAFALVRDYRHQYEDEQFTLWMDRLKKIVSCQIEWQMRWCYEETLFQLCSLNVEEVRKSVETWPESIDLPIWQIKRAAILAEIGALKEAEKIAEDALSCIRARLQPYAIDYSLLSQEGWAMLLVGLIKDNISNKTENFFDRHKDRFEKLETYDCNPWVSMKDLRSDLKYPVAYKNANSEERGFDPGVITRSRQYREGFRFGFREAYSLLRAHEDAGLPIKCGNITLCYDETKQALKIIAPNYLMWAVSNMVRAGDADIMKDWLTRVRVATFKNKEVELLFSNLFRTLQQVINKNALYSKAENNIQTTITFIVPKLLSRLAFRLPKGQLQQLLSLSLQLYKKPIVDDYALYSNLENLFKRILICMSPPEQVENLLSLLTLPIPTENGFEPRIPSEWFEPVSCIEWPHKYRLNQRNLYSSWKAPIMNLVRTVEDGKPIGRQHAIWRLSKIYEIDGLTDSEEDAFGKALWSRIDSTTGLPSDTGLYKWVFLRLPYREKMDAKNILKRYILSSEFKRLISKSPEGGKVRDSRSARTNSDYQSDILYSAKPIFKSNESASFSYIGWSEEEVSLLLKKVASWWDDEKNETSKEKANHFSNDLHDAFSGLVPIIATIILPRLSKSNIEDKERCKVILNEIKKQGIDISSGYPSLLFVDEKYYDEVCFNLRTGLNSIDDNDVRRSVAGYHSWLYYSSENKMKAPPNDLLSELVNRIVSRRQPGLLSVIDYIVVILREYPDLFTEKIIESLCVALQYLLKETELPNSEELNILETTTSFIPLEDKPNCRELSASLAFAIFTFLSTKSKEIPNIINEWKEVASVDHLPEVKRTWRRPSPFSQVMQEII